MKKGFFYLLASLIGLSTNVWAEADDSYVGYDSIVNELKSQGEEPAYQPVNWDDVALHGQLGLAMSYLSIHAPSNVSATGLLKGVEFGVGTNLFSPKARAEALFRNFAQESLGNEMEVSLHEFEGRIIFLPKMYDSVLLRMGGGLSMRYMDVSTRTSGQWSDHSNATLASSILLGIEKKMNRAVSIGPDFSYRSALESGSFERTTWDAVLRLDATF